MKILSVIAFVFLLLSLTLTLPSNSFVYIQTAYAGDEGGGGGGDGGDDGGSDFNYSQFPDDTVNTLHILGPESRSGKKNFTAADLIAAVESRDKGITVVIVGAGKGFEDEILNLAGHDPKLAAKLLSKWSRINARKLKRMFNVAEEMAAKTHLLLKVAIESGFKPEIISKLQNTYDAWVDIGDRFFIIGLGGGSVLQPDLQQSDLQQSDLRLKKEVMHIATLENGIRLYSFQYLWDDKVYVGVMAQDLLADPKTRDAVILQESGYYAVNYLALGLRMVTHEEWWARGSSSVLLKSAHGQFSPMPIVNVQ